MLQGRYATSRENRDQDRALRELRRVLKPDGRLVVGEILADPHVVTFGALRRGGGARVRATARRRTRVLRSLSGRRATA